MLLLLPVLVLAVAGSPSRIKMVSLLDAKDPTEERFTRYAAAVAATEPLRKERNRLVRKILGPLKWYRLKLFSSKRNVCDPYLCRTSSSGRDFKWQRTCAGYVAQSSRVIKASGLSVAEYNALSRQLAQPGSRCAAMRKRVMQQASLYQVVRRDDSNFDVEDNTGHSSDTHLITHTHTHTHTYV